jgi:hypothetical protein
MDIGIVWKKWYNFSRNQTFDTIINICCILSILILTADDPLANQETDLAKFSRILDVIVTLVFFIEAIVKIIALGFVETSLKGMRAYLKNGWNIIDFLVLITTVFYLR